MLKILFVAFLLLLQSCGQNENPDSRLFFNVEPAASGGQFNVLVFARSTELNQHIAKVIAQPNISASFPKNAQWEFFVINWANNLFTGTTTCGYESRYLADEIEVFNINMSSTNCSSNTQLNDSSFLNGDDFRSLNILTCSTISNITSGNDDCNAQKGSSLSYRLVFRDHVNFNPLGPVHISPCIEGPTSASDSEAATGFKIPVGISGINPVWVNVLAFTNSGCTGSRRIYRFQNGLINDRTDSKVFTYSTSKTRLFLEH
jgi:hypothetical protein